MFASPKIRIVPTTNKEPPKGKLAMNLPVATRHVVRLTAVLGTVLLASSPLAFAADVKVLATIAFERVFDEELPAFNRSSGHTASAQLGTGGAVAARVQNNEVADLFFGPRQNIDTLVAAGKLRADSVVDIARSPAGFAVKKGTPKPDIATADGLKRALLAAHGIAYPDPSFGSPSANHLLRVAAQLGIADELKARTRHPPVGHAGGPTLLITGEADLAFQQNCELLLVPDADLLGPLPKEFQLITIMSVAVPVTAREPEAAKAFIKHLQTPAAAAVMRRWGLEPIVAAGDTSVRP